MIDPLILAMDKGLRTLFVAAPTRREMPGREVPEAELTEYERVHAGALMRINHVGEICAQALYQGQSMTCTDKEIQKALEMASSEETEHLAWTEQRIRELGAHKSLINPLWYLGALVIGAVAGKLGDGRNLGFLAETERQVEAHLDQHLSELPIQDAKSRAIVEQMRKDEIAHAEMAIRLGAQELPDFAKQVMRWAARVMTTVAYRL